MQLFEWLFVTLVLLSLVVVCKKSLHHKIPTKPLFIATTAIFLLHAALEGLRWQLLFAYLVFGILYLASLKKDRFPYWLRTLGVSTSILLVVGAIALGNLFPVRSIPPPTGPYSVGTFNTFIVDNSRVERFEPGSQRVITAQIWYPADDSNLENYKRQSLFQELYSGDYDTISFLFGYMKNIRTNSFIEAPVSSSGPFPMLVFNHGLYMTMGQNPQLLEHLASHGYIVASISHPFESVKVSLPNRGARTFSMAYPQDVGFNNSEVSDGGIGDKISTIPGAEQSNLMHALYTQIDLYNSESSTTGKSQVVRNAIEIDALQALRPLLTEQNIENFFEIRTKVRNRSAAYWVEDIQFFVDNLEAIDSPLPSFISNLDTSKIGIFGHSFGGAAAGEFCKIDPRCSAGINLDGTQFGYNWNKPVQAPFLHVNSDTNTGANAFAYYPPGDSFFDVHIPGSEHQDYIDALTVIPILRFMGLAGEMEYRELTDIVNGLVLAFFDEFLKQDAGEFNRQLNAASDKVVIFNQN